MGVLRISVFLKNWIEFCNQRFGDLFLNYLVTHLIRQGSDHAPLYLLCNLEVETIVKPFKFLNFWTKHPDFKNLVKENWRVESKGCPFTEVHAKMKRVKHALRLWSKEVFEDIFDRIKSLEEKVKLMEIQFEMNPSVKNREDLSLAEAEMKKYRAWEENF